MDAVQMRIFPRRRFSRHSFNRRSERRPGIAAWAKFGHGYRNLKGWWLIEACDPLAALAFSRDLPNLPSNP
jgi:hypothetical protein